MMPSLILMGLLAILSAQISHACQTHPATHHEVHRLLRRATSSQAQTKKIMAGQFEIDYYCESKKAEFCLTAADTIRRACGRIESEIKIRRPIKVIFATFRPCNKDSIDPNCPTHQFLGLAAPSHFFPVKHKDDNLVYRYPSTLLKQTDLVPEDLNLAYPAYDMFVVFNELQRWTFEVPPGRRPSATEPVYDMELVMTHELLHGLGFGNVPSFNNVAAEKPDLLMPAHTVFPPTAPALEMTAAEWSQAFSTDSGKDATKLRFYRFGYPTIFERFLTVLTPANASDATDLASFQPTPAATYPYELQASVDQAIKNGAIKPLSEAKAKQASEMDVSDAHKAAVAKAGPGYDPEQVYNLLWANQTTHDAMKGIMMFATSMGLWDFNPKLWEPAAAQLAALNVPARSFKLESGYAPFKKGSSLAHVAWPPRIASLLTGVPVNEIAFPDVPLAHSVASDIPIAAQRRRDDSEVLVNALWEVGTDMTQDFLMYPEVLSFVTFQAYIDRTKSSASGIGPRIKAALVAMGYTPANSKDFVSRAQVAELVREEVPIATTGKKAGADKTGSAIALASHTAWTCAVVAATLLASMSL